jgi:hypothetical protein
VSYQELSTELELAMLAEIAYTSFVDNQLFFAKDRLVQQIREFLVDNLNAPSHLDAETVLKEIEIQQGILVERARDAYSFSHLIFQEYLTAKCNVDNQKIDQLVCSHMTKQHWREVFLLVAGLARGKGGADTLLLAMEKQAQTYLTSDKLKALIEWAKTSTAWSPGDSKASAKRVAAIFLALSLSLALDRDLVLALDLDSAPTRGRNSALDSALDLVRTLDRDFDLILALARIRDSALARDLAPISALDYTHALDSALDSARKYRKLGIFRRVRSIDVLTRISHQSCEREGQKGVKIQSPQRL